MNKTSGILNKGQAEIAKRIVSSIKDILSGTYPIGEVIFVEDITIANFEGEQIEYEIYFIASTHSGGRHTDNTIEIYVKPSTSIGEIESNLIHELSHAVQKSNYDSDVKLDNIQKKLDLEIPLTSREFKLLKQQAGYGWLVKMFREVNDVLAGNLPESFLEESIYFDELKDVAQPLISNYESGVLPKAKDLESIKTLIRRLMLQQSGEIWREAEARIAEGILWISNNWDLVLPDLKTMSASEFAVKYVTKFNIPAKYERKFIKELMRNYVKEVGS